MKKVILVSASYLLPLVALAQNLSGLETLVTQIGDILRLVAPIVFGLAIIYFFWGVAKYILAAGDPGEASKGKSIMIYGVIAIAVMASVYGLVAFLQTSFGIDNNTTINVPQLP